MNKYIFCPLCGNKLEPGIIENKEKLCCSSKKCEYVFWDNPVPVVTAIVEYEGKIILSRNKSRPEKVFGLNTGFLEKNETPETGIIREIKEELNLDAEIIDFIGIYPFFLMNQLLIACYVRAKGNITLNDEIAENRLVPVEKIKPWSFGTGLAVKDWLDRLGKKSILGRLL